MRPMTIVSLGDVIDAARGVRPTTPWPTITTPGPSRFAHRKVGDILYAAYTPSKLAIVREIDNEWDNGKYPNGNCKDLGKMTVQFLDGTLQTFYQFSNMSSYDELIADHQKKADNHRARRDKAMYKFKNMETT